MIKIYTEKEKESIRNTISRAWGSQAVKDFIEYFRNKNYSENAIYDELDLAQAFEMGEWFDVNAAYKYKYPENEYFVIETVGKNGNDMLICREKGYPYEEISDGITRRNINMKNVIFNGDIYNGELEDIMEEIVELEGREEVEAAVHAVAEVYPEIAEDVFGVKEDEPEVYEYIAAKYWDNYSGSLAEHVNALMSMYHFGIDVMEQEDEEEDEF